ncbi:hypothetical protein D7Z54_10600 [Salibacterium salarium]|uniref:YdbS-like PH domain-containing protein n=1 Tax=Salibacterium salarium TaxID=284579 RepID=A0A428N511_9BACI|nr:PH domain-containing protein [Salibacterium salarium]RSL33408.1 hypothetical protein D7Z54_10600 [Salibacterium salarium]
MRDKPSQHISNKAISVWSIRGAIESCFYLLIPIGLFLISYWYGVPWYYLYIGTAVVVLAGVWKIMFLPRIRWKMWRYEILDKEVELLRGIIIVKHTLIPMSRVQHVDTQQGPIYKKYGLTAVMISTAAGVHEIPALKEEIGTQIRDQIAALAGTDEDDG